MKDPRLTDDPPGCVRGWRAGPLPPDTYGWGGVVPAGEGCNGTFYFADFKGDSVELVGQGRTLTADEVAAFNNCLDEPPGDLTRG